MAATGRIAIVGLGLIGGSLALALRRARPELAIIGVDVDPRALELALSERAIDAGYTLGAAPFDKCDLVVLATPAQALMELLPQVAARMRAGAILTDVCGAKEKLCNEAGLQMNAIFVGGHPMAGTEFRGFVAANPVLFARCTVALCPAVGGGDGRSRREAMETVRAVWTAAGARRLLEMNPEDHDRAVTYASHLPYLAATAIVDALTTSGDAAALARELAAGGFRDTTRLAGDGTLGGAAALNRFMPAAARTLADRLRTLADQIERDPDGLQRRLEQLAEERRLMLLPR
jgi:prephenate dehydrogenase